VMALQRAGVEATVSRRTPRGKRRRGMLGSAPNGLDTLDAVGLDDAVRRRTRCGDMVGLDVRSRLGHCRTTNSWWDAHAVRHDPDVSNEQAHESYNG
jgi:hypothetical protein